MRPFTQDEALLRAWKKKLTAIDSKRVTLKTDLLNLLSDERFNTVSRKARFATEQQKLLHAEHQQGRNWKSGYNWLFSLLFFLTRNKRFLRKPGSRLRNALEQAPELAAFDLLSMREVEQPISGSLLNDKQYEKALFDAPVAALEDLKIRFSQRNNADHAMLLERVYALKYRLDSTVYQHLLSQLYQSHPAQTALYFYQVYKRERYDTPADNDFIELNMLTHVVMEHFVRHTNNIYQRNFKMTYLLSLLTLSNTPALQMVISEGQDPFLQLLLDWQDSGLADFKAYDRLSDRFEQQVSIHIPLDVKTNRSGHQAAVKGLGELTATPLQLLKDCLQYCAPAQHPLLTHMGRQTLEQLYCDTFQHPKDSTWQLHHSGHEAITLISERFAIACPATKSLSERWDHSLNPVAYVPVISSDMKLAEKCALTLIKAIQMGDFLNGAYNVRTQYSDGDKLRDADLNWIITRVERLDARYVAQLERILYDIKIYHKQTIIDAPASAPEGRIKRICDNLDLARQAADDQDSGAENQYIKEVVGDIAQYLAHGKACSEELGILYNDVLPRLQRRYLSDDLLKEWQTAVSAQQAKLLRWDAADADLGVASEYPLLIGADHLRRALQQKNTCYKRDFCEESEASKLAVACFAHYMNHPSSKNRQLAQTLLSDLKEYLTPDCHEQWSKELRRVSSSPSTSPGNCFFSENNSASLLARETLDTDWTHVSNPG